MARPRLTAASRWRVRVREAEVANPIGSLPMTCDEPFGAHTDPERFAGSVVRVRHAGGPLLIGVVERTPKNGRVVWVTLMTAGDKLRSRRFLGCEVVHVLSTVDGGFLPMQQAPRRKTPCLLTSPSLWTLVKKREIFGNAKKVVEYRHERGFDTSSSMTEGLAVLEQWLTRQREGLVPRGLLKYLGASRYRLKYDRTWWVDFESDPP